ncbi:redoxin domain-containing protein [Agrobacterium vitis]|uniref:thioredoxin-dependent peroxiredoxin n=1 Tax=Agrobacterium vitis TaxID=373 RepID=A0A109CLW3_AGRVI|nr:redoxin domain-containing protein [Agrobacterium vitis]KAA3509828.1 peroxiredoxin [Agrobacterium vitis]KAA3523351.1 peroxiredoxin [Agrobacterium vitis]MBF2713003.1 redoxin domain-containing protein [Agrobacterium vitis]MCF1479133.1 redoxin domain-containing protein [Agrobacterium vitis]MUO82075.1 redoxin domain-containing protein [Agrobacterium vitis]
MPMLQNDQTFPDIEIPAVGGGVIHLPSDLGGSYGVVLIYRGHWCPFCNEQVAAFVAASDALQKEGIKVVAFSVDDEAETKDFIAKHAIPFKMGHSADLEAIVAAVGAYQNNAPARGRFLENTGFVLAPDGSVVNAVYSSRAIGRLVPSDVIRLVAFMKSLKK